MAGLYAAFLLKNQGYRVTLLEASHRVGGKVWRTSSRGIFLDRGGQAFSLEMKRVAALGKKFGLTPVQKPAQRAYASVSGRLLQEAELRNFQGEIRAWDRKVEAWVKKAASPLWREQRKNLTVSDLVKKHFSPMGETLYRSSFLAEWCLDCSRVGFLYFLDVTAGFVGEEAHEMDFRFEEGMGALAEKLGALLKDETFLHTKIQNVEASESDVVVRAGGKVWRADHLLCAMPAKVWGSIETIGLPSAWRDWSAGFEDGAIRKILLQFEEPFWRGRACEGSLSQPEGIWTMDNSHNEKREFSLAVFVGPSSLSLPLLDILECLVPVFGEEILTPQAVVDTVWKGEENLSGGYAGNRGPGNFPMPPLNHGRVWQAGTEWSAAFPSYIEGALASAELAVRGIIQQG